MNMKGNYNYRISPFLFQGDVISMNMKGNYNR